MKKWGLGEKALARRMSELLKLLEKYLSVDHYLQQPLDQQLDLMTIYNQLELSKHYDEASRKARKLLRAYPYRDEQYLHYQYQLQEVHNQHTQQYKREYREHLQEVANTLDHFYLAAKLRYSSEMINARQVLDLQYDLQLGDEVIAWAQQPTTKLPLLAGAYLKTLLLLKEPTNEQYFNDLLALLRQSEALLPPAELKNLYTYLLNFCTRRINNFRDEAYYQHFLDINELLLKKGLLLEEGVLAPWRFSNLVTAGLRAGHLDWVYNFMQSYRKVLPDDFKENIYNYNMAHYLYWKGDYGKAQLILNRLDLRDLLLAVAAKNLLAKIYYETGQTELLLSFLEAYRIYIHRQRLARQKLKNQIRNFIDFTRKLSKLLPNEKEKKASLRNSLPPAEEILEWDWLHRMATK
jgi:hypothetical protein